MRHFAQSVLRTLQTRMGNQLTRMILPVPKTPRQSRTEKIGKKVFSIAPGLESKGMTSSPQENTWTTETKLLKAYTVKQECQSDKGKQELHPDRSDKISNKQTLKQNEEELQKREQELQEKEKEIEKLKRKEKDAQNKLQQQAQENKILIEELKEEIERLNAKIQKLEEEVKKLKEENEEIKGNQHYLFLAAMCDQLQKNFYQIVFYPHDFSEYEQSYKVVNIERDIKYGFYGLPTEEKKRQARERWSDLMEKLGWKNDLHLSGILQLKQDRIPTAHPEITKDMKESLEERANALNNERKLDEPTFGIVQNLIEMWFKTEDLVQEQE